MITFIFPWLNEYDKDNNAVLKNVRIHISYYKLGDPVNMRNKIKHDQLNEMNF